MRNRNTYLRSLVIVLLACLAKGTQAQAPVPDPAISDLAERLGQLLQEAHATKIIVADLTGPEGQAHPVGKLLADHISGSLESHFPSLEVMARATNPSPSGGDHATNGFDRAQKAANEWAYRLKAKVLISGSFATVPDGILVSLVATPVHAMGKNLGWLTEIIPLTEDFKTLSADPIPLPANGIAKVGVASVNTRPECIQCPPPNFARQGSVKLNVTVTADGRATNLTILRSGGAEMDQKAEEAVSKWRFRPATDANGRPKAVIVPIDVSSLM